MIIPLIKPYMTEAINARVAAVLDSGYLTEGPTAHELERIFAAYVGAPYAIATSSCTTGLELALRAVGVGPGDEVIVADYTYPATASAVAMTGGTPVIVDIEEDTQLISRSAVEAALSPRTRAICPVSLFGNPLDYHWLNKLKKNREIYIIEDAACSIGAAWNDAKVGSFADISVFSLHPRKFITTGEGGMITTSNGLWAEWMNSFKHFGMSDGSAARKSIRFERMGSNYKLSDIQAAVGLGQMQDIDMLLTERRAQAALYNDMFASLPGVGLPTVSERGEHSWQTYSIRLDRRDEIMQKMHAKSIEVQIGTYALHHHPAYQSPACRLCGTFPHSEAAFARTLALPMYHGMTQETQEKVFLSLKECL